MAWRGCDFGVATGNVVYRHLAPARLLHWRIQLAHCVTAYNRVYQAALSPNLLERPRLDKHLQRLLNDVVKMRGLITPASKETRIQKSIFEAIQTINRNWFVCLNYKSMPTGRRAPAIL